MKKIFVNLFETEMKLALTNKAIETCPRFDFQETDEEFALRNLKFFLEDLDEDMFDDIKMDQRIVVDNSLLTAELVFQTDGDIVVTKFIEKSKKEKYVNKYGVQVFRATCDELLTA